MVLVCIVIILNKRLTSSAEANVSGFVLQIMNTFNTLFKLKEEVYSFEQETDESEPDLFRQAAKSFAAIDDLRKEFEALERPVALLSIPVVPPESENAQSSSETVTSERDHTAGNLPVNSNQQEEPVSISGTRLDDAGLYKIAQSDSGLETEGWELDELEEALNTSGLG
ncbi:hypothetical protein O6H91_Y431300 [Diphasiastrum complanatum]|nr:hypothetical protein O6H91_Y431300 [Diphasiastrum complanatum]